MASELHVDAIKHSGGTSAMTINSSGLVLPKMPILQVAATDTSQSYTGDSNTKVEWETVEIDTLSSWSTSNHRYTPTVAGYYLVGGAIRVNLSSTQKFVTIAVSKNGFDTNDGTSMLRMQLNFDADRLVNSSIPIPTGLMEMNGSTDFLEVFFRSDEDSTIHDASAPKSYFFAKLVHAT
tara:strand:- start:552 stop:1088 length:537 start_codon:yes stop_codon:yes gene_type:complete